MAEVLAPANVEALAIAYLTPLVGVDVLRVLPETLPAKFVRVMLTGTRRVNVSLVERRLTVECWASSDADAEALGSLTYAHLGAWKTDSVWVPDGENGWTAGPYADVDPDTGRPRYVMTPNVRQAVVAV